MLGRRDGVLFYVLLPPGVVLVELLQASRFSVELIESLLDFVLLGLGLAGVVGPHHRGGRGVLLRRLGLAVDSPHRLVVFGGKMSFQPFEPVVEGGLSFWF